MFSIYLFLLLILKNQIENIQYNVAYLLLSKTFLFDQTHFTRIYDVVNHKNNNCNQQQQVYQVFGRKSFENIYSGITSYRTLLEVRPKDKFRNYISSDQLVWNFSAQILLRLFKKYSSKAKKIIALKSVINTLI